MWSGHGDWWHGYPEKWQLLSLQSAQVSTQICKHQKAWKETGPATRTKLDIATGPLSSCHEELAQEIIGVERSLVHSYQIQRRPPKVQLYAGNEAANSEFECGFETEMHRKTTASTWIHQLAGWVTLHVLLFSLECTCFTPTHTLLTTQTGKIFQQGQRHPRVQWCNDAGTFRTEHCEKDLEGKVAMGAQWAIISCHVDECGYEN